MTTYEYGEFLSQTYKDEYGTVVNIYVGSIGLTDALEDFEVDDAIDHEGQPASSAEPIDVLNHLGRQGWRLVTVDRAAAPGIPGRRPALSAARYTLIRASDDRPAELEA